MGKWSSWRVQRLARLFLYATLVVLVWIAITFLNLYIIELAALDLLSVAGEEDAYAPVTPLPDAPVTPAAVPVDNLLCTQHERLHRIDATCERFSHTRATRASLAELSDADIKKLAHEFFVVPEFEVLACLNWKTGSSTWSTILMNNSRQNSMPEMSKIVYEKELGALHKAGRMRKLNAYNVSEIRRMMKSFWKFTTVRHPLDRLVSGYTDKLVMQKNYYKRLGPKIMKSVGGRNVRKASLKTGFGVTFGEFLRYISQGGQDIFGTDGGHWHSLITRCQPCVVPYDYVVRTETMHHDAPHIVNRKLRGRGLRLKTKARRSTVFGLRHSDYGRVLKEYKGIPETLFQKIVQRYERDMHMYGYNYTRLPDGQVLTYCNSGCNNERVCC